MAVDIKVIATVFPAIALVLGFFLIASGNRDGWNFVLVGAVFQALYLILKYGKKYME